MSSLTRIMAVAVGCWMAAIGYGSTADPLPVVEYPVELPKPEAPLVVLVSGDGGWAEIDQELAQRWQSRGWPVVGVNALKYFWTRRTPAEFAGALAELLQKYRTRWGERPVMLVGFSFGADVVPFACHRLPTLQREAVQAMILISPTEISLWEAGVKSWFGGRPNGPPVAAEVYALAALPVLVLTGENDPDAFHDWRKHPGLLHELWSGDHHLNRDYHGIDRAVALFWRRRGSFKPD